LGFMVFYEQSLERAPKGGKEGVPVSGKEGVPKGQDVHAST
jgi:hypothetical protein